MIHRHDVYQIVEFPLKFLPFFAQLTHYFCHDLFNSLQTIKNSTFIGIDKTKLKINVICFHDLVAFANYFENGIVTRKNAKNLLKNAEKS